MVESISSSRPQKLRRLRSLEITTVRHTKLSNHSDAVARMALIRRAIVDILPLSIAVIPWGILTGALAIQAGFTPLQAQLMSLLVFAGAAQLSIISLSAAGGGLLSIGASTFMISSRHLLYSITFRQHVVTLPLYWRLVLGFLLTDEMFAVSEANTRRTGVFSLEFAAASGATFYLIWNLATLIGILAGDGLGSLESLGFDFAIVATFIAMTFTELRRIPVFIAVLVSGATAVVLKPYFSDSYIIVAALIGMIAAYLCGERFEEDQRGDSEC